MKQNYDLIIGLGPACSCTMSLRKAGLQHLSFPFDWITPKANTPEYEADLVHRADWIVREFEDWLRAEDLKRFERPADHPKDCYFNDRLNLLFIHDFPIGSDFTAEFPKVKAKYDRRIGRLLDLIRGSKRVLLLRVDRPDLAVRTRLEDCKAAVKVLSDHFAPVRFELLHLHCEHGRSYTDRVETDHGDGVRSLVFDYDDNRPDIPKFQPNIGMIAQILASRYSVRDYRTPEERAAGKLRARRKEYEKYGVHNWWQLRLAKWRMHLKRHFQKAAR